MLASVHIENIALISKLNIDFNRGFTAFTGETGAGKSILVDSINMVSGARMSKDIIRTGTDSCTVSAVFSEIGESVSQKISELGVDVDDDGMLMVQRTLNTDGRSVSKINGRTVPQSMVKNVCSLLINIYGQHEFYSLTDPSSHLGYIDSYAASEKLLSEYRSEYEKLCSLKSRIDSLKMDESEKIQRADFLKFQIQEISAAKLKADEEENLASEKLQIQNHEKISSAAERAYLALYGSEKRSVYNSLSTAIDSIEELSEFVPELSADAEKLSEYMYEIRDIAERIIGYKPDLSDSPDKILDKIEERLDLIYRLKKKYNKSVEDILEYLGKIRAELEDIELSDEKSELLQKEFDVQYKVTKEIASRITELRKKSAAKLEEAIKEQFVFLDMPGVVFKADFKPIGDSYVGALGENGADLVEFLVSTNAGEPLKPMAKIASGGELSRIMLAIKSVLALNDDISTIIFDEVDTGISGKTSHKVGINLKKLSKNIQVFCVTHSAQVASLASNHLKIEKLDIGGRMETKVRELGENERTDEIARILGGIDVTESVRTTASELIEQGKKY
ncbi:MAG: DNA repair protein RecN [Clostridia bacterium]|nr:DNA repair protein RecN [Clostridia bacterium]